MALTGLAACGRATVMASPTPAPPAPSATPPALPPSLPPQPTDLPAPSPLPTEPAPTAPAGIVAGELSILGVNGYTDSFGYYHVVGLVFNNTEFPAAGIELSLELRDAAGGTLLAGEDGLPAETAPFSPYLLTLAQGEASPFDFSLYLPGMAPASYRVTVLGHQAGQVQRAPIEVRNTQTVVDGAGGLYFTGELVNLGSAPAQINGFTAALLAADGRVMAASGYAASAGALLAAGDALGRDRSPFRIRLDDIGAQAEPRVYLEADETAAFETYSVETSVSRIYIDSLGGFHLVGTVTNQGESPLTVGLVAGAYGADGAVLDADTLVAPLILAQGESAPFDFQFWSSLEAVPGRAGGAKRYSVQVDPLWTYATSNPAIPLEAGAGAAMTDQGQGLWLVSGAGVNNSGQELSSAVVVVEVRDSAGALIATGYRHVHPTAGDSLPPNAALPYEIGLYFEPGHDPAGHTLRTVIQGYAR